MKKRTILGRGGFTLVELLVAVLIVGILAAIGLPSYTRSLEKARASEALPLIQALNEAVFTYAAEKGKCPTTFKQLLIEVPGKLSEESNQLTVTTKDFIYRINKASRNIPGTSCKGTVAERRGSDTYKIWNPYGVVNGSINNQRSFACYGSTAKAKEICKTLGYFSENAPY